MISIEQLDRWLRGLTSAEADRAILAAGIDFADLGRARAVQGIPTDAPARSRVPRVAPWLLTEEGFEHRAARDDAGQLARSLETVPPMRLAVSTAAQSSEIVHRLLRLQAVSSAFVAVERPAGFLRRRPWHWPLRIGLVGFPAGAADELSAGFANDRGVLSRMLEVHRVEDEPGAVDVAVLNGPLASAVALLVELRPVANAVVVLDAADDREALVEAQLAVARACTGADASALVPPVDLSDLLAGLVVELSHAKPFDVALTTATQRRSMLWAEPAALGISAVPEIALQRAREVTRIAFSTPPPEQVLDLRSELVAAADGRYAFEVGEANRVRLATTSLEPALDALAEDRWCQARVGEIGDNIIRVGSNVVTVYIGPREEDALAGPRAFDDAALPWDDEDADAFRLTILFVPAAPDATVQRAELDLPRFGRSPDVAFDLAVDEEASSAAARILVLFRNRILQTMVLSGTVGAEATLSEQVALVPSLTRLDDRRAFDVALMANHAGDRSGLLRYSDAGAVLADGGSVGSIAERIAARLATVAHDRRSTARGLRSAAARQLLVKLAVVGRELFNELEEELGGFADASRIQVVSAHRAWFLPLELAYSRYAPDPDATICERYLADPAACDGRCSPPSDRSRLCPNAFWGLSKTIEHHHYDPNEEPVLSHGHRLYDQEPQRGRRDVVIDRILFGASRRVGDDDGAATVAALGHRAAPAKSWKDWEASLKAEDTQLLVLLPHTDYAQGRLEIASDNLERGRIERSHVTGEGRVNPIVVLFGCRTTGTVNDPSGFARPFVRKGARAVFHSATDLRNVHATELVRRLAKHLFAPGHEPRLLSDALTAFRREAVREGFVVALAITAYGDADWRI